ncbi:MAG: PTS sugar transporter subunit IIA [Rhodanobacteraceae bacterium]|nr:PTS sugar transporter subunit IIA [Rhodanobacteraceae bacterium]MBL0041233.1 PTS sugar transporter subunit IIA [Xanthomonadales bacterium]MBP6077986.1 PTS sugar transporter subunit IIA [Xanthomonadales bacterium]MBP7623469.1 PTS sugar transporter subunit IIA [Xanthomonadales bacterium]
MRLSRLLSHDRIVLSHPAGDRDAVLQQIAALLGSPDHPHDEIYAALRRRELGSSTALGDGVAIPHTRVEQLDKPLAAFVNTRNGVDFHAPDGLPVDLFFALLVPAHAASEHLAILAEFADCFGDAATRERLRHARTPQRVIDILSDSLTGAAA